jgi:hypothetical protein
VPDGKTKYLNANAKKMEMKRKKEERKRANMLPKAVFLTRDAIVCEDDYNTKKEEEGTIF